MRKEVFVCDRCKKQKASVQSYSWKTGVKTPDPSGNGYENEIKTIDLCKACVTEIVCEHLKREPQI